MGAPGVTVLVEAARDRSDGEPVAAQPAIVELAPVQWCGNGRSRSGSHGVRRDGGLAVGVAHDVEVQPVLSFRLALFGGVPLRVAYDEHLGDLVRELAHLVEVRRTVEGDVHVQALAAGGFDEGRQVEFGQQLPDVQSGATCGGEVVAGWVEVEDQLIGVARAVGARQPGVRSNTGLVGEVHQRRGAAGDRVLDTAAPSTRFTEAVSIQSGKYRGAFC